MAEKDIIWHLVKRQTHYSNFTLINHIMIYCDVMTHMSKKEFCSLIVGITRRAQRQKIMLNSNFPPKKKKKRGVRALFLGEIVRGNSSCPCPDGPTRDIWIIHSLLGFRTFPRKTSQLIQYRLGTDMKMSQKWRRRSTVSTINLFWVFSSNRMQFFIYFLFTK